MRTFQILILSVIMFGCSAHDPDAILEKSPFYTQEFELSMNDSPKVLRASQEFANKYGFRTLVSTNHFRNGEFSVILINDTLNIKMTNVAQNDKVFVSAVAKNVPNENDKNRVKQFIETVGLKFPTGNLQPSELSPTVDSLRVG